jgi:hypothetical protein
MCCCRCWNRTNIQRSRISCPALRRTDNVYVRVDGFEPTYRPVRLFGKGRIYSALALYSHIKSVGREGFEPPNPKKMFYRHLALTTCIPTHIVLLSGQGSNLPSSEPKSDVLSATPPDSIFLYSTYLYFSNSIYHMFKW